MPTFPAEPPHVACSCPMCCPGKYEINAALANADGELLCKVTGNTCGSDTWPKGLVCPCEPCQSWLESQPAPAEPVAVPEGEAKPTRTVTHQMARNAFRKMHDALHNSLIHPAIVRFARRRYPSLSIPARLDDADIVLSDYICQQRDLATPPPADPAEDFENNLAQSFEDNRKIIGKLRATREPADLEGKLRELAACDGHHEFDAECWECGSNLRSVQNGFELGKEESRALGRAEGLEVAMSRLKPIVARTYEEYLSGGVPEDAEAGQAYAEGWNDAAEAIRALKEKV